METLTKDKQLQTDIAGGKLFNFRPIFFIAVFLATGIAFAYFYLLYGVSALWLLCALPVFCAPLFFCRSFVRIKRVLLAECALALSFLIGFSLFTAKINDASRAGKYEGDCTVVGRVIGKEKTNEGWRLTLDGLYIDGTEEEGELIAYLSETGGREIKLSDELVLNGNISTRSTWSNPYGSNAEAIVGSVRYYAWVDDYAVTGHTFHLFFAVRERMETVLYAGMDETPAAVTMAVLTGDTSGMENGLLANIRYGGVAHIFAVSGLHIGALFAACLWLIQKTKLRKSPKTVRFVLAAGILLFYGGVCGFSSSVVRAITMCLVLYATKLIGIGWDSLENIGVAAVIVLLISPVSLFEVGFQLSFVACIGIVLLARPLQRAAYGVGSLIFHRDKDERRKNAPPTLTQGAVRAVVSFLSVTLSAQIFTAPILIYSFGYMSVWSLLLNCIFVPLIGAVFSLLLFMTFVACVLPTAIVKYLLFVPNVLLSAALLFFEIFDFSTVAFTGLRLTWGTFACYYLACTFATDKWNLRRGVKIFLFCSCIIALCIISCFFGNFML